MEPHSSPASAEEWAPLPSLHRHFTAASAHPYHPAHLLLSGVLVQLVHSQVHAHSTEEPLHDMAHAAGAEAEDHHCILRRQLRHSLQRIHHDSRCCCCCIVSPRFGVVVIHPNSTGSIVAILNAKLPCP